jgi:hypothetical protein
MICCTIGQPDSRVLVILRIVQPLEHAEEFIGVSYVEACPVIPAEIHRLAALPHAAGSTDRVFTLANIFHGIGQQVDPDLFQQSRIAPAWGDRRFEPRISSPRCQAPPAPPHQIGRGEGCFL